MTIIYGARIKQYISTSSDQCANNWMHSLAWKCSVRKNRPQNSDVIQIVLWLDIFSNISISNNNAFCIGRIKADTWKEEGNTLQTTLILFAHASNRYVHIKWRWSRSEQKMLNERTYTQSIWFSITLFAEQFVITFNWRDVSIIYLHDKHDNCDRKLEPLFSYWYANLSDSAFFLMGSNSQWRHNGLDD